MTNMGALLGLATPKGETEDSTGDFQDLWEQNKSWGGRTGAYRLRNERAVLLAVGYSPVRHLGHLFVNLESQKLLSFRAGGHAGGPRTGERV